MAPDDGDGLKWENKFFSVIPTWTREPSMEAIELTSRKHLAIPDLDSCRVSFFAQGGFNKLYRIDWDDKSFLMRVALPVSPKHKTNGEVATLRWMHEHTDMPVPTVLAFNDSRNDDNMIGFEWILMSLMPGATLGSRWRKLTMAQKVALVERVADFQAQLSQGGRSCSLFRKIGTLETTTTTGDESQTPSPGPLVALAYIRPNLQGHDMAHGPFRTAHGWLRSILEAAIYDNSVIIDKAHEEKAKEKAASADDDAKRETDARPRSESSDSDDEEDEEAYVRTARRLLDFLPKILPAIQGNPEITALYHGDLNKSNILVDDEGNISAIVDWECVSAVPLWATANTPEFLQGRSREEEPVRDKYGDLNPENAWDKPTDEYGQDNEGKTQIYWEHLLDYECTRLRRVYDDKLRELWPTGWRHAQEDWIKADFNNVVGSCEYIFAMAKIRRWLDGVEAGNMVRWQDVVYLLPDEELAVYARARE